MSDRIGVVGIVLAFCVLCAMFGRDDFTTWFGIVGAAVSLVIGTVMVAVHQNRTKAEDADY